MGRPKLNKNKSNVTLTFDDGFLNSISVISEYLGLSKGEFIKRCVDGYVLQNRFGGMEGIAKLYEYMISNRGEAPEDVFAFVSGSLTSYSIPLKDMQDALTEPFKTLSDTLSNSVATAVSKAFSDSTASIIASVKENIDANTINLGKKKISNSALRSNFFNAVCEDGDVSFTNCVSYYDRFIEENPTLEEGSSKLCFDDVVLISCFLFLRPDDYAIYASESYDFYYSFNDKAGWTKSYAYSELMTFALAVQRYGLEKTVDFNASMKFMLKNDAKFFIDKETGCYQLVLSGMPDTLIKSDVVRNLTGKGFKVRSSVYSPVAERMQSVIIEIPKEVHMEPVGEGYDYPENKVDFMQMYLDALNDPEDGLKALRSPNKPKL